MSLITQDRYLLEGHPVLVPALYNTISHDPFRIHDGSSDEHGQRGLITFVYSGSDEPIARTLDPRPGRSNSAAPGWVGGSET